VVELLSYVAFSTDPSGGNPAGVVLDARRLTEPDMAAIAEKLGFSETAFLVPRPDGEFDARYFSPRMEVPFCGHATVAAAVAHAETHGPGELIFHTQAGPVPVSTARSADGAVTATLVSVPPRSLPIPAQAVTELLGALRWSAGDLDPALPPRAAYAGAWHPVIAAGTRARLADLDYDVTALTDLMRRNDWATVALVWRETPTVFHARNPFPVGGVFEDPATGAAAAALGGYLRELALIDPPATLTIHQGHDMGRPSTITVTVPADPLSGLAVSGTAVRMPGV
jgi:PhzF family phenazine biosynthesis protein